MIRKTLVRSGLFLLGALTLAILLYVMDQSGGRDLSAGAPPTPTPTKQPSPGDTDGDGCTDQQENGLNEFLGGRRNFLDRWDYYNPTGDGFNRMDDLLGVIEHYAPDGAPPYDVNYDTGPIVGPNYWNGSAPDGKIDLANDILAMLLQYHHDCSTPPPPGPTPPASAGLAFSIGIDTGGTTNDDCDTSGAASKCTLLDYTFTLNIYLDSLPNGVSDYVALNTSITYSGVTSTHNGDLDDWVDCGPIQGGYTAVGVVDLGCTSYVLPVDYAASTYTGLIGTIELDCFADGQISMKHGEIDTALFEDAATFHIEESGSTETLTINCDGPTATPTSTPLPTSTPTPTSTPCPGACPTPTFTPTDTPTATNTPTPTTTPTPLPCPRGNDDFEQGVLNSLDVPCWTADGEGFYIPDAGLSPTGGWCNQSGTQVPQGDCAGAPSVVAPPVAAPPQGLQTVMTNQGAPGTLVLYRCQVLASSQIEFQLYLKNTHGSYVTTPTLDFWSSQQFRADLVTKEGVLSDPFTTEPADVLMNLYQTQPGDPLTSGYDLVTADAGAFIGQEVCLRFGIAVYQFILYVGVDDVKFNAPPPTPTPTPSDTPTPAPDSDGDGCSDPRENGPDEMLGGMRDWQNPDDYYDVVGGGGGPPDQIIDLSNDIFGVIIHYSPMGTESEYDVNFDRGPSTGPEAWNMTAPDGVIDLSNDILGVIQQYLHDCR